MEKKEYSTKTSRANCCLEEVDRFTVVTNEHGTRVHAQA